MFSELLKTIQIFDTTTENIALLPQTTIGIFSFSYGVIGTKIIIATGITENGGTHQIFSFDTATLETNQVGEYSDFEDGGMGGAVYKNVLYGFGGYQISGNKLVKFTWTFPLNSNDVFIQETLDKNIFDLIPEPIKTEIGAQNVYKGNSNNEAEFVDAYLHNGEDWVNVNTDEKLKNK